MRIKHIISILFISILSSFTCVGAAEVGGIEINGFISQGCTSAGLNHGAQMRSMCWEYHI